MCDAGQITRSIALKPETLTKNPGVRRYRPSNLQCLACVGQ